MTFRPSRRRAMQAALVTAASVTLPRSRAAAQPAKPIVSGDATITAERVQGALNHLDALIEQMSADVAQARQLVGESS